MVTATPEPAAVELHTAKVVIPVDSEPIANGAVAVRDGLIEAVGTTDALVERFATARCHDWGGVITPGLVNAHTHLQYTSFHAVGAESHVDYTAWSQRFRDEYDRLADNDWEAVARDGLAQVIRSGTTAVADVVTDFAVRDVLHDMGVPGVAYLELLGVDDSDWDSGLDQMLRDAVTSAPTTIDHRVGVSPHAPYSVDGPVITSVVQLARSLGARTHIHVAESDAEDEFYRSGTGALADRVRLVSTRRVGVLESGGVGTGAAAYLQSLGATGPDIHYAHGVYLGTEGRAILAASGTIVALCPRSNLVVGVDPPPVAAYLAESVPFAVGTDSLGSVDSLDLMADVQLLARLAVEGGYDHADLADRLLHAATMGGATAIGLDERLGSLSPGKRADFAVFDLAPDHADEAAAVVVAAGPGKCIATVIGGDVRSRVD